MECLYRVLVVTNLWPTESNPGFGSFVRAQMESLRPLGVEFDLLFIKGRESRWNYVRAIGELRRRVQRQRYNLIHAHFGLAGLVARCQFNLPVVVSFMGDDVLGQPRLDGGITLTGRFYQASSFALSRRVSAVIVKSREMKSKLRLNSAYVIPNGVDLDLFKPADTAESRQVLGLDLRKKYILFPYDRAEARKRYDLIEAAAAIARSQVPELEVLCIHGIPRRLMPLYMNAADVLVLASLIEGSPNAVKEAMAVNLPVVAVDVGDVADLLKPAEGNYVVPRNAEGIAARMVEVCRKGARSRSRDSISHLSMINVARQVVEVYKEVTSGK